MNRTKLAILLVDDDEDAYVATRYLISNIRDWQIQLDWASTYEQGLAIMRRREHDIYLIDYRLNGHDGLQLMRAAVAHGCRAPMIILTGLKDHEMDVRAMEAGAADYLIKDRLDAMHLERCIRYSLERQKLHEQLEEKAARLQALARQLSQAEQSERSRISRLLHDHLQQILVSIKMYVESLTPSALQDQQETVQTLLDQAMDVSRTLTIELSPPVLMDVGLSASLSWLANWMKQKYNLHVATEIDPEAEPGTDPVRFMLFHAVRELLFNVTKHAKVNEARLTMTGENGHLRITVTDEGVGFDPQTLDRDAASASAFGLIHLRERIRLIGGTLEVDAAPGRGCRIILTAPRHAVDESPGADAIRMNGSSASPANTDDASTPTRPPFPGRPIRVLLVDDHAVMRQGLARTLADHADIKVIGQAGDGEQALALAHQLQPDVVLMDVVMPRLNGFDATLRLSRELPDMKVIGLSMYSDSDMAQVMQQAGALAYVSKGEPVETLLEQIRGSMSATS
ncbi:MAG: response regulator [Phycisphaeraceae bacterium]